jgi:DNA-directed RNA polymerase specialized sigma24 family protein
VALSRRDFRLDYLAALDRLPVPHRRVFELKQAGESDARIASLVGLSRLTVTVHYHEAKASLREQLQGYEQLA